MPPTERRTNMPIDTDFTPYTRLVMTYTGKDILAFVGELEAASGCKLEFRSDGNVYCKPEDEERVKKVLRDKSQKGDGNE